MEKNIVLTKDQLDKFSLENLKPLMIDLIKIGQSLGSDIKINSLSDAFLNSETLSQLYILSYTDKSEKGNW